MPIYEVSVARRLRQIADVPVQASDEIEAIIIATKRAEDDPTSVTWDDFDIVDYCALDCQRVTGVFK